MRLIDADMAIEIIRSHTRQNGTLDSEISCILEEVPTAFDKERAISELNERAVTSRNEARKCENFGLLIRAKKAEAVARSYEHSVRIIKRM